MQAFPFWMLRDLARGPCEEPHCGVCQVFSVVDQDPPGVAQGMNVWQMMAFAEAVLEVWDWHDTRLGHATEEAKDGEMYRRCLVIYAAAISEMSRRAELRQCAVIVPPRWLTDDMDGFKYVLDFYASPDAAPLLRVA